ncbi:hypothetical protein ACFWGN_17860 [Oerskovia sp. NPDC060338]|uniref:hypothetical protein n=1 Tax=Oerskovia sp. NPDC060338 TaxID=3347100 RepID=UPI0036685A75
MSRIRAVVDWPEKSVSALAERSIFDAFVSPGGEQDPFELGAILDANRFDLELPQAITSAYKHSCAFLTTALGDTAAGEPEVTLMARSAEWSTAIWDKRRRAVSAALAITDTDKEGRPSAMDVYLPDVVLICTRRPSGSWTVDRRPNPLREVLVEPLAFDPQLDRPFGRSRISRTVMNITDHALSAIVRGEIGADFYTLPKIIITRVAEDAFARGKWQMAVDRITGFTADEEGNAPDVKQLQQMTMQPLTDQYRMYASQFSGATGVPIDSLGIITENPPSAESIYAADRRLTTTAKRQNRIMSATLRRVAGRIVRLRDGGDGTEELRRIDCNWVNPEFTSPGAAADALVKVSAVFPWISESEVGLEMAGFTSAQITRLLADKRRAQAGNRLEALAALGQGASTTAPASEPVPPSGGEDPALLKIRFDALGAGIRAGVAPNDVASRVGLPGIEFTGAVPVSLRMPESEAAGLEEK